MELNVWWKTDYLAFINQCTITHIDIPLVKLSAFYPDLDVTFNIISAFEIF